MEIYEEERKQINEWLGKGLFTKLIVLMIHFMKKEEEVVEVMREKL